MSITTSFSQCLERSRVGGTREQLITIDEIEQSHRLATQRVDHMSIIDNMASFAFRHRLPAPERCDGCGARAPACDNTRSGREKACGAVEQEKGQEGRKIEKRRGGDLTRGVLI